jgi:uncharacterized protein (DUF433 family)
VATVRTEHPHVVRVDGVAGGQPVIAGSRISVSFVARLLRAGADPSEIIAMYPHLAPAAVYDAISYYLDHREEIDHLAEAETIEAVAARHGATIGADGRIAFEPR